MPGAAHECLLKPLIMLQRWPVASFPENQQSMRSENRFQRHYDGASLRFVLQIYALSLHATRLFEKRHTILCLPAEYQAPISAAFA
jgi:hypothetical protein